MKKVIFFICSISILCFGNTKIYGQTYSGVSLYSGSSNTGTPGLPNNVGSSTTMIFEAEYEIVFGPDCIEYPTCAPGTTNTVLVSGYDVFNANDNYFLARLIFPKVYNELKEKLDGDFTVSQQGKLYFKYIEKYVEGTLDYQIYDYQRNEKLPAKTLTKKVGTNFNEIDLKGIGGFVGGQYYTLEVQNGKGEKFMLRFKYVID